MLYYYGFCSQGRALQDRNGKAKIQVRRDRWWFYEEIIIKRYIPVVLLYVILITVCGCSKTDSFIQKDNKGFQSPIKEKWRQPDVG